MPGQVAVSGHYSKLVDNWQWTLLKRHSFDQAVQWSLLGPIMTTTPTTTMMIKRSVRAYIGLFMVAFCDDDDDNDDNNNNEKIVKIETMLFTVAVLVLPKR